MSVADKIKSAPKTVYKTVDVKEWEGVGQVRVKSWTTGERLDFDAESDFLEQSVSKEERNSLTWARVVARSIVEEDGSLAFEVPTLEQLKKAGDTLGDAMGSYLTLSNMPSQGLYRLYLAASSLNSLSIADEERIEKKLTRGGGLFVARLARTLGKYLWQIREEMPASELAEWRIVDAIDPIGEVRGDLQAGVIADAVRPRKRGKLSDYVIQGEPPSKARRKREKPRDFVNEFAEATGLQVIPKNGR